MLSWYLPLKNAPTRLSIRLVSVLRRGQKSKNECAVWQPFLGSPSFYAWRLNPFQKCNCHLTKVDQSMIWCEFGAGLGLIRANFESRGFPEREFSPAAGYEVKLDLWGRRHWQGFTSKTKITDLEIFLTFKSYLTLQTVTNEQLTISAICCESTWARSSARQSTLLSNFTGKKGFSGNFVLILKLANRMPSPPILENCEYHTA